MWAAAWGDHAAPLSIRRVFVKCWSRTRPVIRSTVATVRRPGQRIAPISKV